MATLINPCRYKVEREEAAVQEYSDEIMCAGWNPQLAHVGDRTIPRMDKHTDVSAERASTDVDDFLQKMYTNQG